MSEALLKRNEKLSYGGISVLRNKLLNHWKQPSNTESRGSAKNKMAPVIQLKSQ